MNISHVIIGGAPKSGTSAVFKYLSAHPEVSSSSVKETAFFIECDDANIKACKEKYDQLFFKKKGSKILLEGSSGYLGYSALVAPKVKKILGKDTKFIFILRNPAERIYSYYWYSVGLGNIPQSLSFSNYLDACLRYEENGVIKYGLKVYDLLQLQHGKYAENLKLYISTFGANNIEILSFDRLSDDPRLFMFDVCDFMGINRSFFTNYEFRKVNVTQTAKLTSVHHMAVWANRTMEPFLRKFPRLKELLKNNYQKVNIKTVGYRPMEKEDMQRLNEYYRHSLSTLSGIVNKKFFPWVVE